MTSRNWCFTLNNYTKGDEIQLDYRKNDVKYMIYGREIAPKTGTPHLQGFVIMPNACRMSFMKSTIHDKAHWTACKGSVDQNFTYCAKSKDIVEIGVKPVSKQGKRNDLVVAVDVLKKKGLKAMIEELPHMYVKFHGGFDKLASRLTKPRDPNNPPIVTWLWGPSGTGKTRQVFEKEPDLWISGKNLKWWEGYENQEAILIDDFRGDFCTFHELLRILDRVPFRVEVKGGSRELNSKRIYITSCYKPEDVYDKNNEEIYQLMRRLTVVTHVGKKVVTKKSDKAGQLKNVTEVVEGNTIPQPILEKILPGVWFENDSDEEDDN